MDQFLLQKNSKTQAAVDGIYSAMIRRLESNPLDLCPVDSLLNFVNLSLAQSCGKCTPCRIGLNQLSKLLEKVLDDKADSKTLHLIYRTAETIAYSSDCAIGSNAGHQVLKALDAFEDDFKSHIEEHRCNAAHSGPISCQAMCPAGVNVPGYISLIEEGRCEDAVRLIRRDNPFPIACAYVCEHPCEKRCRRRFLDDAINIRGLKKFAVENAPNVAQPKAAPATGKKISVVGGGPGGLTAAYYLTLMGHEVTVYEKHDKLGGMLRYGIPAYRFPREKLDEEIKSILSVGIQVKLGIEIGKDISLETLKADSDAIYLSIGAQGDKRTGMEGENAIGVMSAVDLLGRIGDGNYPDFSGKKVIVIGGGNVAMDATRTSLRLGASKVSCVYRRRKIDMTAQVEEVDGANEEGAELIQLEAPVRIEVKEDGSVAALITQPQIIGKVDRSGRPRPEKAFLPERRLEADIIILAIGQEVESDYFGAEGLPLKRGAICSGRDTKVDGVDGIWAGGDCATGPSSAISAIAAGKAAAQSIDRSLGFCHQLPVLVDLPVRPWKDKPACGRVNLPFREASERNRDFSCIELNMTEQEAIQECSRCLHCDSFGYGLLKGGKV